MATALTGGYIYFIESDGTDNDNWIIDHSGDPDLLDLDQYTEGTEYCKIEIPQNWKVSFYTGISVSDVGSGLSYDLRNAKRGYKAYTKGIQTSVANAKLIDQFFMSDRHTSGATATYKKYYMIIYFGVNDHWLFTDHNGTQKSYCKGVALGGDINWIDARSLTCSITIHWRSVWQ